MERHRRGDELAHSRKTSLALAASSVFASMLVAAAPTHAAATFVVTRTDDPTPNGCGANNCSLREAIIAANAAPGSKVQLRAATYTLSIPGGDTKAPNPAIGDLDIRAGMTIAGVNSASTIVQFGSATGKGIDRIFDVYSATAVSMTGLTIQFGRDAYLGSGGCIKNTGVLTLASVVVTGCTSPTRGAGIASYGTLTIRNSVISNNSVTSYATSGDTGGGGGIAGGRQADGTPGHITILSSRIANNSATNRAAAYPETSISYGGGFSNVGVMIIRSSTVTGNIADSSAGGISGASGTMTIDRSTFSDNKATRDAGGLDNDGILNVVSSTFSDNQAGFQCAGADCKQAFAGGLLSTATATTTVDNSTFTGNSCGMNGGGISGGGLLGNASLRIRSSTIVGNTCTLGAGVSSNAYGDTHLMDTILAGNTSSAGGDCSGHVTSEGYNVIGNRYGCAVDGDPTGNISARDPKASPLADNGGPTQTMALLASSPALNAGRPGNCLDTSGQPLTTDQRGFARPAGGRCDIGAYESQPSGASAGRVRPAACRATTPCSPYPVDGSAARTSGTKVRHRR